MKKDIVISGVGGQGIISIAYVLGSAALKDGLQFKQSEVHGMSQRGGAVESHLRMSDAPIHSDIIPEGAADLILSVEPVEALRYLKFLAPGGTVLSSSTPFVNIPDYPDMEAVRKAFAALPKAHLIDADGLAKKAGNVRTANIVMTGAASLLLPLKEESLLFFIEDSFKSKGDKMVEINKKAFYLGREAAKALGIA
jgi:indolepyruvate ferredoxin oxidoreductase beta subunit